MIGHRHHWNGKAWVTALIGFPCLSWLSKTSRALQQEVTQASIHCEGAETQIRHIALSQRCCCWEVDLVFTCLHSIHYGVITAKTNSQATCGLETRKKQNWSNRGYQTKQLNSWQEKDPDTQERTNATVCGKLWRAQFWSKNLYRMSQAYWRPSIDCITKLSMRSRSTCTQLFETRESVCCATQHAKQQFVLGVQCYFGSHGSSKHGLKRRLPILLLKLKSACNVQM